VGELELIRAIADRLSVAIWVARAPDGQFVYANRAFDDVMGMGPEPAAVAGGYAPAYGIFDREGNL
jgi:PAS domain-containing protein